MRNAPHAHLIDWLSKWPLASKPLPDPWRQKVHLRLFVQSTKRLWFAPPQHCLVSSWAWWEGSWIGTSGCLDATFHTQFCCYWSMTKWYHRRARGHDLVPHIRFWHAAPCLLDSRSQHFQFQTCKRHQDFASLKVIPSIWSHISWGYPRLCWLPAQHSSLPTAVIFCAKQRITWVWLLRPAWRLVIWLCCLNLGKSQDLL